MDTISSVSTTQPTPTGPSKVEASPSIELTGKILRSGLELTESEAEIVARHNPSRLVILAGPPNCGKTTLVATLYELMRSPDKDLPWFAGSQSLVAFEQRCHLSRVASGLTEGTTGRTPFSDEQAFYHLRTCSEDAPSDSVDLLLFDLVGERFNQTRVSFNECRRVTTLSRANFLAVLLDGSRLANPGERFLAVEECINFLQCCADSNMIGSTCRIQIVTTKRDQLGAKVDRAAEATIESARSTILSRLAQKLTQIEFFTVAARPSGSSELPTGFGMKELLVAWCKDTRKASAPQIQVMCGPLGRESEQFAKRHFKNTTT
jgi:hypothetical protein